MNLVDENNRPLNAKKEILTDRKEILDATGEAINTATEAPPMTTEEVGRHLSTHMLNGALKFPTNELVNKQFDILYHMALNILCHRITNIGCGMEAGNLVAEWDNSRAYAAEKQVQEDMAEKCVQWREQFFNGELVFHNGKPT